MDRALLLWEGRVLVLSLAVRVLRFAVREEGEVWCCDGLSVPFAAAPVPGPCFGGTQAERRVVHMVSLRPLSHAAAGGLSGESR